VRERLLAGRAARQCTRLRRGQIGKHRLSTSPKQVTDAHARAAERRQSVAQWLARYP
jgi:hypothetical protein